MKVTLVMEELRHKYNLMDIEENIRHIKADISLCRQEMPVKKLFLPSFDGTYKNSSTYFKKTREEVILQRDGA